MWYATTLMSQSAEPCTPSSEPSLIDITNRLPSSIATIVCFTGPESISLAAPMVRLPMPETMVARSAAEPRGPVGFFSRASRASAFRPGSEESRSRPSEETTATDWMPGTSSTRLVSSQCRLRASLLSPKVLGAVNCLPPRRCPPWLLRIGCRWPVLGRCLSRYLGLGRSVRRSPPLRRGSRPGRPGGSRRVCGGGLRRPPSAVRWRRGLGGRR